MSQLLTLLQIDPRMVKFDVNEEEFEEIEEK
jgi:hypothetical protein